MMNTETPEYRAKLNTLSVERIAVATAIKTALEGAGFLVAGSIPAKLDDKQGIVLTATSTKLADWKQEVEIAPYVPRSSYYGKIESNIVLAGNSRGYRGRERRYPKATEAAPKVVAFITEKLEFAMRSNVARQESDAKEALAKARREAELGQLLLPPGMEVAHWTGTPDSQAAWYSVRFERHDGLCDMKLTAAQVQKLAAVINEIVGTQDLWVVTAQNAGEEVIYNLSKWDAMFTADASKALGLPKAAAEQLAERAETQGYKGIELVAYPALYRRGCGIRCGVRGRTRSASNAADCPENFAVFKVASGTSFGHEASCRNKVGYCINFAR